MKNKNRRDYDYLWSEDKKPSKCLQYGITAIVLIGSLTYYLGAFSSVRMTRTVNGVTYVQCKDDNDQVESCIFKPEWTGLIKVCDSDNSCRRILGAAREEKAFQKILV